MLVVPRLLDDVISVMPAILPNWRSNGVATEDAMISGLAPGKPAPTEIVGKSIWGRGETGNSRKATAPASAMAAVKSVVATGRCMNGEDRLIGLVRGHDDRATLRRAVRHKPLCKAIEENVNDRSCIECKNLTQEQAANHGDAQGAAKLGSNSRAEGERQAS